MTMSLSWDLEKCVIDICYKDNEAGDEQSNNSNEVPSYTDLISKKILPLHTSIEMESDISSKKESSVIESTTKGYHNHPNNLKENKVGEELKRIENIINEKRKAIELLAKVFPKDIANQLFCGNSVKPQTYECVTIYFSDIVGFTSIVSKLDPIQVRVR